MASISETKLGVNDIADSLVIRQLNTMDYSQVWQAMKNFTDNRDDSVADELWLVEHQPVFTQGQAGKPEHLLMPGDIEVVKVDRGGQVTYHGPGQQVIYFMINLRRKKMGVRLIIRGVSLVAKSAPQLFCTPSNYYVNKNNERDCSGSRDSHIYTIYICLNLIHLIKFENLIFKCGIIAGSW